MTKVVRHAAVALVISGGVLASGCGAASPASSAPISPPSVASRSLGADVPATSSNSVPETPWWDRTVKPPQSPAPAALSWTLSSDILFDSGSATLSPSALSQLSGILAVAQHHCDATITVLGYTDSVPDPTFPDGNQGLSSARAAAVAGLFEKADIPGDRVEATGEGASNPVGDDETLSGRQANRRVVIQLSAPAASCPPSPSSSPTRAG